MYLTKTPISFRIDSKLHRLLKRIAHERRVTESAVIREALAAFAKEYNVQKRNDDLMKQFL